MKRPGNPVSHDPQSSFKGLPDVAGSIQGDVDALEMLQAQEDTWALEAMAAESLAPQIVVLDRQIARIRRELPQFGIQVDRHAIAQINGGVAALSTPCWIAGFLGFDHMTRSLSAGAAKADAPFVGLTATGPTSQHATAMLLAGLAAAPAQLFARAVQENCRGPQRPNDVALRVFFRAAIVANSDEGRLRLNVAQAKREVASAQRAVAVLLNSRHPWALDTAVTSGSRREQSPLRGRSTSEVAGILEGVRDELVALRTALAAPQLKPNRTQVRQVDRTIQRLALLWAAIVGRIASHRSPGFREACSILIAKRPSDPEIEWQIRSALAEGRIDPKKVTVSPPRRTADIR